MKYFHAVTFNVLALCIRSNNENLFLSISLKLSRLKQTKITFIERIPALSTHSIVSKVWEINITC